MVQKHWSSPRERTGLEVNDKVCGSTTGLELAVGEEMSKGGKEGGAEWWYVGGLLKEEPHLRGTITNMISDGRK